MKRERIIAAVIDLTILNIAYFIMCGAFYPFTIFSSTIAAFIMLLFVIYLYGFNNGIGNSIMGIQPRGVDSVVKKLTVSPPILFVLFELILGMYFPIIINSLGLIGVFIYLILFLVLVFLLLTHGFLFISNKDYWNKKHNIKFEKVYKEYYE